MTDGDIGFAMFFAPLVLLVGVAAFKTCCEIWKENKEIRKIFIKNILILLGFLGYIFVAAYFIAVDIKNQNQIKVEKEQ